MAGAALDRSSVAPSGPRQYDIQIDVVTPENISFKHDLAGPFQRLPALMIDLLIQAAAMLAVVLAFTCSGVGFHLGFGPMLVLIFFMQWFYFGAFEALWNGQTPGKRAARLRVVTIYGQPITGTQAVLRNLLRFVDMMPVAGIPGLEGLTIPTFQLGLLSMAASDSQQRLGDLVCGTIVIREEPDPHYGVVRFSEPLVAQLAGELPRTFVISRTLALTLSNYVQRRNMFSWPRRSEIARHLGEPLCRRLSLPGNMNHDLLLCALYHKAFIAEEEPEAQMFQTAPRVRV